MFADRDAATARRPRRRTLARRRRAAASLIALTLLAAIPACDPDDIDPNPACADALALPFGETRLARLSRAEGDPALDGSLIDYYALRPDVPGTLTIEMGAEKADRGVDPFLYLWEPGLGDPIAQAWDASGEGPHLLARISVAVGVGCHRVGASTWPGASEGEYTIRADFVPGG